MDYCVEIELAAPCLLAFYFGISVLCSFHRIDWIMLIVLVNNIVVERERERETENVEFF